jgi:hypothetical protein
LSLAKRSSTFASPSIALHSAYQLSSLPWGLGLKDVNSVVKNEVPEFRHFCRAFGTWICRLGFTLAKALELPTVGRTNTDNDPAKTKIGTQTAIGPPSEAQDLMSGNPDDGSFRAWHPTLHDRVG